MTPEEQSTLERIKQDVLAGGRWELSVVKIDGELQWLSPGRITIDYCVENEIPIRSFAHVKTCHEDKRNDAEPVETLRDKIAIAAMRGLIQAGNITPGASVQRSYEIADAMMKERGRK